jgi:hypothetical protein
LLALLERSQITLFESGFKLINELSNFKYLDIQNLEQLQIFNLFKFQFQISIHVSLAEQLRVVAEIIVAHKGTVE